MSHSKTQTQSALQTIQPEGHSIKTQMHAVFCGY